MLVLHSVDDLGKVVSDVSERLASHSHNRGTRRRPCLAVPALQPPKRQHLGTGDMSVVLRNRAWILKEGPSSLRRLNEADRLIDLDLIATLGDDDREQLRFLGGQSHFLSGYRSNRYLPVDDADLHGGLLP